LDSYEIKELNNGWYRCSISFTSSVTIERIVINLSEDGSTVSYLGDVSKGLYVFGAMVEKLPYATSYTKTEGSAVTRVGDVVTNAGNTSTFNSSEGVLFLEVKSFIEDVNTSFISLYGDADNFIAFYYSSFAANIIRGRTSIGGVTTDISYTSGLITDYNKIAVSWNNDSLSLYVNGILRDSVNIPSRNFVINTLSFDLSGATSFYGKTKQTQVFDTALTDAELITLTTL